MEKYYFGYYYFNGKLGSVKRSDDYPPTVGMVHEVQIKKTEWGLKLEDLEFAYPLPESKRM